MFQFFIHLIWPKRASRKKKLDKESSVRKLKYNTHCPLNAFDIVLQFPLFTNIDLYWSICLIRNYCLLLTNESIIYMNVLSLLYFVVCLKMTRNVLSIYQSQILIISLYIECFIVNFCWYVITWVWQFCLIKFVVVLHETLIFFQPPHPSKNWLSWLHGE